MAAIQEYRCPRCGGVIAFDSTIQKMKCPFCNTEFEIETLAVYDRELKSDRADDMSWQCQDAVEPDLLIPFRVKREAAREAGSIRLTDGKVCGALFPVWILSTTWNDRNYLFVMNGQTGRQRSMQLTEKKDLYLYRQTERKKRAERAADTKL